MNPHARKRRIGQLGARRNSSNDFSSRPLQSGQSRCEGVFTRHYVPRSSRENRWNYRTSRVYVSPFCDRISRQISSNIYSTVSSSIGVKIIKNIRKSSLKQSGENIYWLTKHSKTDVLTPTMMYGTLSQTLYSSHFFFFFTALRRREGEGGGLLHKCLQTLYSIKQKQGIMVVGETTDCCGVLINGEKDRLTNENRSYRTGNVHPNPREKMGQFFIVFFFYTFLYDEKNDPS